MNTELQSQAWFEMRQLRQRSLDEAVWIPLHSSQRLMLLGQPGYEGYVEEFFGANTIMVPTEAMPEFEEFGWSSLGLGVNYRGWVDDDGNYSPSDSYSERGGRFSGVFPVLVVEGNSMELPEWHLHQDLVVTLRLKREGNTWLAMDEGYEEVARLRVIADGGPSLLEFRSTYLKDYLNARGMALRSVTFRSRTIVVEQPPSLSWPNGRHSEIDESDTWEGRISAIHEGGMPWGEKTAVFHWFREGFDDEQDVPRLQSPVEDNSINSRSWHAADAGKRLYQVVGELWRNEWVYPGATSPRVRRDESPATAFFTIDAAGTKLGKNGLSEYDGWLWFRPGVINALADIRGGGLKWYTETTGSVSCSPDYDVHFGINQLGLINVYAEDIAHLPDWQQHAWVSFNVPPEGAVSVELLDSQVRAQPATTLAPEQLLETSLQSLDGSFEVKFGSKLFRDHDAVAELIRKSHRFRAIDEVGLFALAKDLNRLVTERLDISALRVAANSKDDRAGSIRLLELLLAKAIESESARKLTGPLVGIYGLRHADAHLPSSDHTGAYELLGIDRSLPYVHQGRQLIQSLVDCLADLEKTVSMHFSVQPK